MPSLARPDLRSRYGPWALVAGASAGLGAEFAEQIAAHGLHVLLVARRAAMLDDLAARLRSAHGVEVRTASLDLGAPDLRERLGEITSGLEIGLCVYNAAFSMVGRFLDQSLDDKLRILDVNCRGPLILTHEIGSAMAARKRGGILLMSSLAGFQGSPLVATYAATKAFNTVFAEGLWYELRREGVDVMACCAGATRTPAYEASKPAKEPPSVMDAAPVVREALAKLGKTPSFIPGWANAAAQFLLGRVLPRGVAVRTMGSTSKRMYEP
jgi:uncharacterized protein